MARILVVDDEPNIVKTIDSILTDEGYEVFSCGNGEEALDFLTRQKVDLVFLDIWLPDMNGIDILEKMRKNNIDSAVIMISGHGSIDMAVRSTKLGAFDFIQKPPSMERVVTAANNAVEQVRLKRENEKLRHETKSEDEMIGFSPRMLEVKQMISTAAQTSARVLITGASGTGKELVARAICRQSRRSDKPFIKVNCAAIPGELIESELFGHEKGAFTGALARRPGKFEASDGGTLFLDEICDMSLAAQSKVLRVLQEQQFERVGGNETITVDVRVIAATNIDIRRAIIDGDFREDLFYRLNVIPIELPSLVERKDDIPHLADYYLKKFTVEHGVGSKEISDEAMKILIDYNWPGNVRELKNIIERLCVMVPGDKIDTPDVKRYLYRENMNILKTGITDSELKRAKENFEKEYISSVLKNCNNEMTRAAKELGVSKEYLKNRIEYYDIETGISSNE